MNAIQLHPTAATAVPVTHIATGVSGRKARTKKVAAQKDITCDALRALLLASGKRFTTKHTKAELRRLLTEPYFEAAAYTREKAARKARRAAAKAVQQ